VKVTNRTFTAAAIVGAAVVGLTAGRLFAAPQGPAGPVAPAEPLTGFGLASRPPTSAVLLFTGKPEQIAANFYKRYTKTNGDWTVDGEAATPNKDDLTSKVEFGDCYVHAEFKCAVDANGKSIGEGNSGIGLHGRYEVQILDSYGNVNPGAGDAGALYSQKAPMANPSKKPGEWQKLDIVFRAPRFDGSGTVVEKPRATVFFNGVIVQNNTEFNGPTGIQYGEFKGMTKTGPIVLQGDHSPVSFRNVWAVSL
jgi:hypothetical protein